METPPQIFENTNEEGESYEERSPEEQVIHLQEMAALVQETGFIETPEMKALRNDPVQWQEEAQRVVEEIAKEDPQQGMKMHIGYLLDLASIYYEKRNPELYFENIDDAADIASRAGFTELLEKINILRE